MLALPLPLPLPRLLLLLSLLLPVLCLQPPVELQLDKEGEYAIPEGEPLVLCYDAPQFNIWRFWDKTMISVDAVGDWVPSVYGVATDDVHGLVDSYIKAKAAGEEVEVEDVIDVASRAAAEAAARSYGFGPLELLWECPPVWAPDQTACTKEFSPFYKSCVAVTNKRNADPALVKVKAWNKSDVILPLLFFSAAALLRYAKPLSQIAVLWYASSMGLWVLVGFVIMTLILCRKFKVPGAGSSAFALVSITGYGVAVGGYAKTVLRRLLVQYWEGVLVYAGVLALCGFIYVARVRSNPQRKNEFQVTLLWSLRLIALLVLLGSTRSGCGRAVLLGGTAISYLLRRLFKKPKPPPPPAYQPKKSN